MVAAMAGGETANDFPDLNALENMIGMKTPESLLVFMKNETHWNTAVVGKGKSDNAALFKDSISEKIRNLKLEMSWLRSADVRILRQLASVHCGMEALRWLMEERGALASCGSSPTGSESSLVTAEEHEGPHSPTPVCLQDADTPAAVVSDAAAPPVDSESGVPSNKSSRSGDGSRLEADGCPRRPDNRAGLLARRPRVLRLASAREVPTGAESVPRTLVRANTAGGGREHSKGFEGRSRDDEKVEEEEKDEEQRGTALFDYDAQWHWVESVDDVTFV